MSQKAFIVVDLSNGDAGKGSVVDALVRKHRAHTVIRFNGGAQAAHRVVVNSTREHVFSQFGSGTFVPGVRTFLSKFVLVQPWALLPEEKHLHEVGITDAFDRLFMHEDAFVITPFHRAANRLRELARGDGRHGSCGIGVGETARDALELDESFVMRVGDFRANRHDVVSKLCRIQQHKAREMRDAIDSLHGNTEAEESIREFTDPAAAEVWYEILWPHLAKFHIVDDVWCTRLFQEPGNIVFEGAQGVLIDEWRGFHPYTTWSTCTYENALALLREADYRGEIQRVGVVRAYATRHGPGPFVTEDEDLTTRLPDACNKMDPWQRGFRVGHFDCVATRYAIETCGGIDSLAITCLDRLRDERVWYVCTHYELSPEDVGSDQFDADATAIHLVRDMRLGVFQDLAYQERLTHVLERTRPVKRITAEPGVFAESVKHHVDRIVRELDVPVSLLSFGPSFKDKHFL